MQNGYAQHGGHITSGTARGDAVAALGAAEQVALADTVNTNTQPGTQPDANLRVVGDSLFIPDPVFLTETGAEAQPTGVEAAASGQLEEPGLPETLGQPEQSAQLEQPAQLTQPAQLGQFGQSEQLGRPAQLNQLGQNQLGQLDPMNPEAGSADAKSLRKLENSALQQITAAKEQSGGDPSRYASAIARARREQIETAQGVKGEKEMAA